LKTLIVLKLPDIQKQHRSAVCCTVLQRKRCRIILQKQHTGKPMDTPEHQSQELFKEREQSKPQE
jgi:hypothetical protein